MKTKIEKDRVSSGKTSEIKVNVASCNNRTIPRSVFGHWPESGERSETGTWPRTQIGTRLRLKQETS